MRDSSAFHAFAITRLPGRIAISKTIVVSCVVVHRRAGGGGGGAAAVPWMVSARLGEGANSG